MSNRVVLTGLGMELAVRPTDDGERLNAILQVKAKGGDSETIILLVEASDPHIINCFREYRRRLPLYVRGELRMRGDQLIIFADVLDYAKSKPYANLSQGKFVSR
jgi:RNase adaptor protein for sRNA GlmZ degradation